MFLHLSVILLTRGHVWLLQGAGHAWLLGACMVAPGGVHGCSWEACMVAPGGPAWWRGHAWQRGAMCGKEGHAWQRRGMHGKGGHVWQRVGVCMAKAGGHVWRKEGACMVCTPPTRYGRSLCGQYASYWNAFLLINRLCCSKRHCRWLIH